MSKEHVNNAIEAWAKIAKAIIETIELCPNGAPAGQLYAAVMTVGVSLEDFERLMEMIYKTGWVRKQGHLYYPGKKAQ